MLGCLFWFVLVWFFKGGVGSLGCLRTRSVDQAGLELAEICLPHECWD